MLGGLPPAQAMKAVGLALVLCLLSLFAYTTKARFHQVDVTVLDNLDFSRGQRGWSGRGRSVFVDKREQPVLVVKAQNHAAYVGRTIAQPKKFEYLRVTADVRSAALTGDASWHGGVLALLSYDATGRRAEHWPNRVAKLLGTQPWHAARATFPVDSTATRLFLVVYAAGLTGQLEVRNLGIAALVEKPAFRILRYTVLIGWFTLWLWLTWILLQPVNRTPAKLTALLLANVLLVAGLAPQPYLNQTLKSMLFRSQDVLFAGRDAIAALTGSSAEGGQRAGQETFRSGDVDSNEAAGEDRSSATGAANSVLPSQILVQGGLTGEVSEPEITATNDPTSARGRRSNQPGGREINPTRGKQSHYWVPRWEDLDKTEHVFGFAVLGFVVGFAYQKRHILTRVLGLAALSACVQTLQLYPITREPDIADLRADLIGIAIGTFIAALIVGVLRRVRKRQDDKGRSSSGELHRAHPSDP